MQSPLPPMSTLPAWILDSKTAKGPDASGPERKASEELRSRPLQDAEAAAAMLEQQHAESTRQQGHAGGQQARKDKETFVKPRGSDVSNLLLAILSHWRAHKDKLLTDA